MKHAMMCCVAYCYFLNPNSQKLKKKLNKKIAKKVDVLFDTVKVSNGLFLRTPILVRHDGLGQRESEL